jgi:hypothetical protein
MNEQSITQTSNRAGGSIVGRDQIVVEGPRSPMSHLLERFRQEAQRDPDFKETIEQLKHYLEKNPSSVVLGVTEKLTRAGRKDDIADALVKKERFAKILHAHMFSPVAQEIFACILGKLEIAFATKIKPLIRAGRSRIEIDAVLYDDVITPCYEGLESNDLKVYYPELVGMLYFLTGNCHIDWH